MPPRRRTSKDSPAKLAGRVNRRWRVIMLRNKREVLGSVEAPSREEAKPVAAARFGLDEIRRQRLIVHELV